MNVAEPTRRSPYVAGVMAVLVAGCVGLLVIGGNPFEHAPWIPPDGRGLRPDLQTAVFSIYPPLLYAGLVSSALPFAFVAGRKAVSARDEVVTRRWIASAWLLLTCGVLGGLWWEWSVRGWNATWQLQPLRNTTVLAWAAVTALALHSWSSGLTDRALATAAFLLSAFAAAAVTAEHASTVAAFARSGLAAGLLLAAIAGLILSRLVGGRSGVPAGPPPTSRGPSSILAGIGLVLLAAGLTGATFRRDITIVVPAGGQVTVADPFNRAWTFTSAGTSRYDVDNRRVTAVALSASVNEERAGVVAAELRQFVDGRGAPTFPPVIAAGALHSPAQSIQAALAGLRSGDSAVLTLTFHPLVALVWLGGAVFALAGFVFLWTGGRRPP